MREIKFRAWDTVTKEMYEWEMPIRGCWMMDEFDNPRMVYMQFTGLHDKNGKEIYESDLVYAHLNNSKYIVKHGLYRNIQIEPDDEEYNCYGWHLEYLDSSDHYADSMECSERTLEVIGNIYENPEPEEAPHDPA